MGVWARWKQKSEIVDFMRGMERAAKRADTEISARAKTVGGLEHLDQIDQDKHWFYQGVQIAVQDCQRHGEPRWANHFTGEMGRGFRAGWALMTIASLGVRQGSGLPPIVLPDFNTAGRNQPR